jgi:hypothetical protein
VWRACAARRLPDILRKLQEVYDELGKEFKNAKTRDGLRQALGFGDKDMPAMSIFAMPNLMEYAQQVRRRGPGRGQRCACARHVLASR